jgi:hypothetical protein
MQVSTTRCRGRLVPVRAGTADLLGVLAFSALPFAAVQALADSDLGKKLQVREVACLTPWTSDFDCLSIRDHVGA